MMKPEGRTPQLFGVFFPSLSRNILWKLGVVSRVRFAAQKPRALDTTPTFQPNLLRRKRREGVANRNHRRHGRQNSNPDPADISLLRAKNGLDNGVHFSLLCKQWGIGLRYAVLRAPVRRPEPVVTEVWDARVLVQYHLNYALLLTARRLAEA